MSAPDRMRAAIAGPEHREGCGCPVCAASGSSAATQLVIETGGVPTTTTEIIAAGTGVLHKNVLGLVRENLDDLNEFGRVAFETRPFETAGGQQTRQVGILTEEHATLLLTYMRNNAVVRVFKKRLVREFFAMRRNQGTAPQSPTPAPLPDRSELARWVIEAEDKAKREKAARIAAEHRTRELEAPAAAWSTLENAVGDYAVADAAKVLSRDPAISIGRDRLFRFMAIEGWTYRDNAAKCWKAKQAQVNIGRLVEKVGRPFLDRDTEELRVPNPTVRVTAKGLKDLHRLLRGSDTLPTMAAVTE